MKKFEIEIVNYFDRDNTVAEIYFDSKQWAEISHRDSEMFVQFYSHPSMECWEFPFAEAIQAIELAKSRLFKRLSDENCVFSEEGATSEQINIQAQKNLESILNHPQKKIVPGEIKRFGKVVDIYAPRIGGVRYNADGEFIGFLEL